jgi:hypothetical protein
MKDAKKKILMLIMNDVSDSNYKVRELENEKHYLRDRQLIRGDIVEAEISAAEYSISYWKELNKESVELYAYVKANY